MGAAWRDLSGRDKQFDDILHCVKEINSLGLEVIFLN